MTDTTDNLPGVPSPYTDGARLMTAQEVPDGWHARGTLVGAFGYSTWAGGWLVEARPVPVPTVTVEIPRDVAESVVDRSWMGRDTYEAVVDACRNALEASEVPS